MSVEQTSQLLQLILNAVLMVVVCGVLLMGLLMHQSMLYQRWQAIDQDCRAQLTGAEQRSRDRYHALKRQQITLRHRYRQNQNSILLAYAALLVLLLSTFLLACRTFLSLESLIPASLLCFVCGNGILLLSAGMALLEIHRGTAAERRERGMHFSLAPNPPTCAPTPAALPSVRRGRSPRGARVS